MLEVYYGAFYGSVWASNVDYGKGEDAEAEVELIAGVVPTVGAWTLDLSVTSYQYPGEESDAYAYVFGSATRDFGNGLSLGAGYGYYWYEASADYNELWAVADYAFNSGLSFHAEASYDIDYDRAGNDYLGVEGGVVVPLPLGFEASANSATRTTSPTRLRPRISGTMPASAMPSPNGRASTSATTATT